MDEETEDARAESDEDTDEETAEIEDDAAAAVGDDAAVVVDVDVAAATDVVDDREAALSAQIRLATFAVAVRKHLCQSPRDGSDREQERTSLISGIASSHHARRYAVRYDGLICRRTLAVRVEDGAAGFGNGCYEARKLGRGHVSRDRLKRHNSRNLLCT